MNTSNNTNKISDTPRYIPRENIKKKDLHTIYIRRDVIYPFIKENITTYDDKTYVRICSLVICAIVDKQTGRGKLGPTDWQVDCYKTMYERYVSQDKK